MGIVKSNGDERDANRAVTGLAGQRAPATPADLSDLLSRQP